MAGHHDIREDMQVLGSDGGMIGRVDGVEASRIKLKRDAEIAGARHHYLPIGWIARVDQHVHLNRTAAQAREQWTVGDTASGGAANFDHRDRKSSWIPWAIGVVLLLVVIVLGFRGCGYAVSEPAYENSAAGTVDAPGL